MGYGLDGIELIAVYIAISLIGTYSTYNLNLAEKSVGEGLENKFVYFALSLLGVVVIDSLELDLLTSYDILLLQVFFLNVTVYKANYIVAMINSLVVFVIMTSGNFLVSFFANKYIGIPLEDVYGSFIMVLFINVIRFTIAVAFKENILGIFGKFIKNVDRISGKIKLRIAISMGALYFWMNFFIRRLIVDEAIVIKEQLTLELIVLAVSVVFLGIIISHIDIVNSLTENEQKYDHIKSVHNHDQMTGAFTREAGMKKLEQMVSCGVDVTVCFIDMDNLKAVNDKYGHLEGDRYIKTVSDIVRKNIRKDDVFLRYGGDEFIVGFLGSGNEEIGAVVDRINREIEKCSYTVDKSYRMGISYGIYQGISEEGAKISEIIAAADQNMYKNKIDRKLKVEV